MSKEIQELINDKKLFIIDDVIIIAENEAKVVEIYKLKNNTDYKKCVICGYETKRIYDHYLSGHTIDEIVDILVDKTFECKEILSLIQK